MKKIKILAFIAALGLHTALLSFGGLLFFHKPKQEAKTIDDVALVDEAKEKEQEKPKVEEEIKTENEPLPEMAEAEPIAPEPLSLGELEVALNPGGDGGGFSAFHAGTARLGGATAAGDMEAIFSMADLDQKPRPLFQVAPTYPPSLRKVPGSVVLVFVVDKQGKVATVQVEKSTDPAFEKPAVDAVKQWKFEPGVRSGQKVQFKMRVPIKFAPA